MIVKQLLWLAEMEASIGCAGRVSIPMLVLPLCSERPNTVVGSLVLQMRAVWRTNVITAGDLLILETRFETKDGTVRLVDFMPPRRSDGEANPSSLNSGPSCHW